MENSKVIWILVFDGNKGRIFASNQNQLNFRLITKLDYLKARLHSRDLESEKPHGVFQRNQPESKVDLQYREKHEFVHHIVGLFNEGNTMARYHDLIIVVPPRKHYVNCELC